MVKSVRKSTDDRRKGRRCSLSLRKDEASCSAGLARRCWTPPHAVGHNTPPREPLSRRGKHLRAGGKWRWQWWYLGLPLSAGPRAPRKESQHGGLAVHPLLGDVLDIDAVLTITKKRGKNQRRVLQVPQSRTGIAGRVFRGQSARHVVKHNGGRRETKMSNRYITGQLGSFFRTIQCVCLFLFLPTFLEVHPAGVACVVWT